NTTPLVTQPVQIFFIVLVIILFTPLLLNKLKIPHIIGMIVAGVVIGPYGFNVLDNDSSFAIFGQVGLLYLMFLAGLEIDMYHLRLNMRRGLLFGVLTLVIPLVLGVLTSVWLLDLGWLTSLLLGAMYASHTLISYPVVARFGITKAPAVLIAIVGTIIAVIGALLVLAATVNVRREGAFDMLALLILIAKLAAWCVALLYIYPRATRRFFKSHNDKVTQYVFVLAMVFFAAWTAQLIGLEPVLGAFFAGLLLNRYVPPASSLMGSIEFVGNALFIPYFLISVGMMINVRVIANVDTLTVAGIMLAVAIVSKWLPAFIACRINRLDSSSEGVMFGLTAAHTAVALAVVSLGYNLGMLDTRILNSTVLVILVTCALAPIITAANAPKLKVKLLAAEEEDGVIRQTRVNNTLITVANPANAVPLVDLAVLMRNDRGRHSMFALHVRDDNTKSAKNLTHASLEAARKAGAAADVQIETLERFDLNTVTGVLNVMEERDITEVILGMHRRAGVIDSFFGNKVEKLLRSTNKMVLISRCFIPLNTVTRIVVWVPYRAQYETGFSRWVRGLARLTRQLGCRIIFSCCADAQPLIRGVIYRENYGIRCEFNTLDSDDDYVLLANKVLDDDLFVIIGARPNSVSYTSSMSEMPTFLQRYFAHNNLLIVYPEQFGEGPALTSFVDPMSSDIAALPSPLWRRLRNVWRRLALARRSLRNAISKTRKN
ncbi:MAG: cation:proton antiporter, partial [Muribaculaceae bacterium]|nr:cation:proton antiporter [Muribaculaceae bacterium]